MFKRFYEDLSDRYGDKKASAIWAYAQKELRRLEEIRRVLRNPGLLIAPNFVEHKGTAISRFWSGVLKIAGIRFEHQWSSGEYLRFLKSHGWKVLFHREIGARIALMYTECTDKYHDKK